MSLNPAQVHVREEGILVTTGGTDMVSQRFQDPGEAARYLAVDIWRDRSFWPSRSKFDPPFDWDAFNALVRDEMDALEACNGWRIEATAGDYTLWAQPGREMGSSRVTDVAYQATKGEIPSSTGGYRNLDALLRAKNLFPHDVERADGPRRDVRAVVADRAGMAWVGCVREGRSWILALDESGEPVVGADATAARDGALEFLERGTGRAPGM